MHARRDAAQAHQRKEHPDDGLPAWVLLVCLAVAAAICLLVLQFTISMMSVPATPQPTS